MSWEDLFTGYQCRDGIAELRTSIYLHRPDKLNSPDEVAREDARTAATIKELQARIASLQSYRTALQQRYAALATMDSRQVIRLERYRCYDTISYFLSTRRRYEDGTETVESNKKYPGKERNQAIKDFQALAAASPAAILEKSIDKPKWER